jgi:hypothetical protein
MVYASLKEAWGTDEFCKEPPENPYVVKDPIVDKANFKSFRKQNFGSKNTNRVLNDIESDDQSYMPESKYYKNNDNETKYLKRSNRVKNWCKPEYKNKYFLEEDEYSDITSVDTMDDVPRKMIGRKIKIDKKMHKYNSKDNKIIEGFENSHKKMDCESMLEHLKHCRICSAEVEDLSKNIFIREFIIFAGCGIIMFLFLDLLRKIAQKTK